MRDVVANDVETPAYGSRIESGSLSENLDAWRVSVCGASSGTGPRGGQQRREKEGKGRGKGGPFRPFRPLPPASPLMSARQHAGVYLQLWKHAQRARSIQPLLCVRAACPLRPWVCACSYAPTTGTLSSIGVLGAACRRTSPTGRLKPTTTVTTTSDCAVRTPSNPPSASHVSETRRLEATPISSCDGLDWGLGVELGFGGRVRGDGLAWRRHDTVGGWRRLPW